jgi:hypothetical protein
MKKVTLLAAAAAVSALVATPVMARDNVRSQSGAHMKSTKHHARIQNRAMYRDRTAYRQNAYPRNAWNGGPGAVAGGIVGGAIGTAGAVTAGALNTAGAIATAPFGGPYYSNTGYYDGGPYYSEPGGSYPFGNAWRYGYRRSSADAFASADTGGWEDSGYGNTAYDNPGYGYASYDYNGVAIPGSTSFDARNGFTCRPGSVTKLGNQRVICQ